MKKNERFEFLMSLALGGDECAPGDLWLEFGYRFAGQSEGVANDAD